MASSRIITYVITRKYNEKNINVIYSLNAKKAVYEKQGNKIETKDIQKYRHRKFSNDRHKSNCQQ